MFSLLLLASLVLLINSCTKTVTKTVTTTVTDTVTNTVIDSNINLSNGLLVYYPFNGNTNDSSGHHLNGVIVGGVSFTTDVAGMPNSAAAFDGSTGYITVSDPNAILQSDAITVSFLTNLVDINSAQDFLANANFNDGSGLSYAAGINADGSFAKEFIFGVTSSTTGCNYAVADPTNGVNSANVTVPGQWYHVVGIFTSGLQEIFVNGVLNTAETRTFTTTSKCSANSLIIGAYWMNGLQPLHGSLDELRIYNRALNQNEINTLARAVH